MEWRRRTPLLGRNILSHRAVNTLGIVFNFVEEEISAPTDWCFQESHHVVVVHLDGQLEAMECVFESGLEGRTLPRVGDVWVIPADQRYAALAKGRSVGFCEMSIPKRLLGSHELAGRFGHSDPFLHHATRRLASVAGREDDMSELLRDSLGESILLHLTDSLAEAPKMDGGGKQIDPARLKILLDYIRTNLDQHHSLASMATIAGIESGDFILAFKTSMNTTPHQFLIGERISRAKTLLISTNLSVTEIAMMTGFSTPSHFATSFRQNVGVPPTAYRDVLRR